MEIIFFFFFNQEVALSYASLLSISCPHAAMVSHQMHDLWSTVVEANCYIQGTK